MEAVATVDCQEIEYTTDFKIKVLPFLDDILQWLKDGMTEYSISEKLGIHYNTFARYRNQYNVLSELYARAMKERNCLVMHKMFERAIGYEHPDLFIAQNKGEIVKEEIIKHYPPDVNAADLYLRNNDPDYKSAKSEGVTLIQNNFQLPQLQAEIQKLEQELKSLEVIEAVGTRVIEE